MSEYRFRRTTARGIRVNTLLESRGRKPYMFGNPNVINLEATKQKSLGGIKTMTSTALVRPGDIDAVDSRDLLTTLIDQNVAAVENKNEVRERKAWVTEQRENIYKAYKEKAKAAYEKVWSTCKNSKVGHDFHTRDVQGRNVKVCNVCSYHTSMDPRSGYDEGPLLAKYAKEMNDDLIQIMVKRMISLDVDAGLLIFPTEDEMPPNRLSRKSKWFSGGKDPVGAGIKR